MSKVLFLVNHDIVIYNFRLELVERLLADGHQVIISSPYGERIDDLITLGCEYHRIDITRHSLNLLKELKLIVAYKRLLNKVYPDIVFSFTIKPNIYGSISCKSKNIPCVVNITGLGTAVENDGIVQKIIILLYKYALVKVQRVFFQNESNMQFFIDHKIALGKHSLLPGSGVNLNRFSILDYPKSNTIEFAFISRIMKEKGVDQYIEAARYITGKFPNTIFHICGFCEQAYEEQLNSLANQGIIIYHGMVRDVRVILKNIHCIILPTYYPEGVSNVLLESSACARPIITTNRPGCREVVDDGINGFIVREKNTQDLIQKIEKFIGLTWEARKKMGLAGREKVENKFDRQIVVNKYMEEVLKV